MLGGGNSKGQLGDGFTLDSEDPVNVLGLPDGIVAIDAGSSHTCAITGSATQFCWGPNDSGQLGIGDFGGIEATAEEVVGLSGVSSVSAGGGFTCAIISGGNLECWGNNFVGQLGNGSKNPIHPYGHATPKDVLDDGPEVWTSVSAGGLHTCVIAEGNIFRCWGRGIEGQIGDGSSLAEDRTTPVDVGPGGIVAGVSAGNFHTCAVTTGGAAKCWGANYYGRVGDGTITTGPESADTNKFSPVAIVGLDGCVASIGAGGGHSCALLAAGGVRCWGDNYRGQLGAGDDFWGFEKMSPIPVDVILTGCSPDSPCIVGHVFDGYEPRDGHSNLLKGVSVELRSEIGVVIVSPVATSDTGYFLLQAPAPGKYTVRVSLRDAENGTDDVFEVRHTQIGTEPVWIEKAVETKIGQSTAFVDVVFSDAAAQVIDSNVTGNEDHLDDMANVFYRVRQFVECTVLFQWHII